MKKARAARDRAAPKLAALPPPLPEFDELDAIAASDTPTVEAAWWITHQVSEHIFSMIAHGDPRTGEPLPRPLTEILSDVRGATATGCRPFPRDRLLGAVEFTVDALEHLLDRYRHRIVRVHEQLPFHQLREVDTRSMAWLARQPGRNIREKLSGRTHALGVKRDASADTTENRLLRSFAKLLVQRASTRLENKNAYDGTAEDAARVRRLEDCVRLCDERLRRSELADVPTLTRLQANNVLLSDPYYSRVFRAWKWLRDDEEALRGSWKDTLHRTRVLLCWMVAAQLVTRERVVVTETLGCVLTGRGDDQLLGVEVLGAEAVGADWFLNPPFHFLVLPAGHNGAAFRIRISLDGEFILVRVATLGGRGLLAEESVSSLAFEVRPTSERLQPRRGIGIAVDGLESALRGADRAYADLAGLTPLATQMARQILQRCDVNPNVERREPIAVGVADGARLGIQLDTASLHVSAQQGLPLVSSPWALALGLPGDVGGIDWLDGRADRELVIGAAGRSLLATGDVVDADEQADVGMLALAADRVLGNLASELKVPVDARVAYAVPDAVDEFSQRSLRSAFGSLFHRPVPVWRSVAAAMSWASVAGDRGPRPGELVVVVDTEFGGVSLTVLTARYDEKLARTHQASRGIYWERKPPLPPDEQLETLGWPHVLRAYARMLVDRELGVRAPELQERVVEDMLRSGKIGALVARGGSIFVQVPSSQRVMPDVVEFFEDPAWFDDEVARWSERLDRSVKDALATLGKARVVLVGGPCAYPRFHSTGRQTGRIKLFNEDKGFGFIVPDEGGADVFFHIRSIQVPEQTALRRDLAVEFDIGKGRKGPEAQRVTLVSRLTAWLRQRTVARPQALAEGARECLLRLDTGSLTWREWLPELSLEVVRDGHFGELPLLERGTFVDPFLGDAMQFTVPETLTLGRGHRWFSFPLLVGRQGRRPVAWEARLDSPAFPLDHDVRARLRLSYRYGLDTSYELAVEPASPDDAPFARVKAKWIKGGEDATTSLAREPLPLERRPWERVGTESFLDAARSLRHLHDERSAKRLFGLTRACWSEGRSLATAPAGVQRMFSGFRDQLLGALPPELNVHDMPRALEILALLHEDAPTEVIGWLLELDARAGDERVPVDGGAPVPLYRRTAGMLAMLVGDGEGARAALLHRLLERLRRHGQGDTFDAQLAGLTMRALGNAAWRHPGFISSLAAAPGGAALVIASCRRSLHALLGRIPVDVSSDEHRQKVSRQYGTPFRDACELLLALMAVAPADPVVAPLRTGSPSADGFAKLVRQIDARFSSIGATPYWRVRLNVNVPPELHRMSPVAFALNTYLAEGAGANLVHVAGADLD
jgi:cold shock CspA family protein